MGRRRWHPSNLISMVIFYRRFYTGHTPIPLVRKRFEPDMPVTWAKRRSSPTGRWARGDRNDRECQTYGESQTECSVPLRSSALDNSLTFLKADINIINGRRSLAPYLMAYQLSRQLNPQQTPADWSHSYVPNQFGRITRKDWENLERFKWDSRQPVEREKETSDVRMRCRDSVALIEWLWTDRNTVCVCVCVCVFSKAMKTRPELLMCQLEDRWDERLSQERINLG